MLSTRAKLVITVSAVALVLTSLGSVQKLLAGHGCGYDCPSSDNLWCPGPDFCQSPSHCNVGNYHKYLNTSGFKKCVQEEDETCNLCQSAGCKYQCYSSAGCHDGDEVGEPKLEWACYDICAY